MKWNMRLEATDEGHTDVSLYIKIMTSADFQAPLLPVTVIAHVGMLLRFVPFTCSYDRLRGNTFIQESLASTLSISASFLVLKYFHMSGVPRMEQRKHFSSLRERRLPPCVPAGGPWLACLPVGPIFVTLRAHTVISHEMSRLHWAARPHPPGGRPSSWLPPSPSPYCHNSHLALFHF